MPFEAFTFPTVETNDNEAEKYGLAFELVFKISVSLNDHYRGGSGIGYAIWLNTDGKVLHTLDEVIQAMITGTINRGNK